MKHINLIRQENKMIKQSYESRYGHPRKRIFKKNQGERKQRKIQEAKERQEYWNNLTKEQKINILLARPGNCTKQLKKLGYEL